MFNIIRPSQLSVTYTTSKLSPGQAYYENYTNVVPFDLIINYVTNGTFYSPKNIPFFDFFLNGSHLKDFQTNHEITNFQGKIISFDIRMYFYLFKTDNNSSNKLVQSQNRSFSFDLNQDYLSGKFLWNFPIIPMLTTSTEINEKFYIQFIFTITTHFYSDTNGTYISLNVFDYAPQIQYHISNQTQLIFDSYNTIVYPQFSSFTLITQGVFNLIILVTGLVFIACTILIMSIRRQK